MLSSKFFPVRVLLRNLLQQRSNNVGVSKLSTTAGLRYSNVQDEDPEAAKESSGNWEDVDGEELSLRNSNNRVNSVILRGDIVDIWSRNEGKSIRVYLAVKHLVQDRIKGPFVRSLKYRIDFYDPDNPENNITVPEIDIGDNVTVYTNIYNGNLGDEVKMYLKGYYLQKHT